MIELLAKKYIKNADDTKSAEVRQGYGVLCGAVGIFFNIILFIIKLVAGILSGSVAIMADAFNNLSDFGSSIIMMVGFKMSGHKPDTHHPFGHGRIEYVTGLVVSMLIILMGAELVKTSVSKIFHPQVIDSSAVVMIILFISIAVKLYMYMYNKRISDRFASAAMKATAMDSLFDAIATTVVLMGIMIEYFTGARVDGICGLFVAGFVLYSGVESAKDTIDPLLGTKPSPEYVKAIEKYVASYDDILGMHDLVIHDYGPGRMMISFHAEVASTGNLLELHDTIDNIERKLNETLNCHTVIHMDPVVINDDMTDRMRRLTELVVKSVDESLTMHDFRMIKGPTHTNLIFDVVMPYELEMNEDEVREQITMKIIELPGNHYAVVDIDRPMV